MVKSQYQLLKDVVKLVVEDEEKMMSIFSKTDWYRENIKSQLFYNLRNNSYFVRLIKGENVSQSFVNTIFQNMLQNRWYTYRAMPFVEADIANYIIEQALDLEMVQFNVQSVSALLEAHSDTIGSRFLDYCFYFDFDKLEEYLRGREE